MRCIQEQPSFLDVKHAISALKRPADALLGQHHRHPEPHDLVEKLLGPGRIELRGRLVEQNHARSQRDRRGEAHALKLAARELSSSAVGKMLSTDELECLLHSAANLGRRRAEVLETKGDLVRDLGHHNLLLGVLKDARNRPGEVGRTRGPRVVAPELDGAAKSPTMEMRHEASEGSQERRLPGAGRPEERNQLSRLERQRHIDQGVARRSPIAVGERYHPRQLPAG